MEANYYKNIEYLWALLERLNKEDKLELAARLMSSLRPPKPEPKEEDSWLKLYGAWSEDDKSADDMIHFLRNSRNSNREIEPLD